MKKNTESGQAIVLLVFAVIGLIGFTALAIDGGMVYSDRRHAQSASDAASLAGGGFAALALENYSFEYQNFDCDTYGIKKIISDSLLVAQNRANSNDYVDAEIEVSAVCEDNGPLFDEKYIDITTDITRQTRTSLIHIIYKDPIMNEVESTVRVRPRYPLAFGNAIVALNDADCSGNKYGVSMNGSSVINVTGGGIFTNGCFDCDGLSCPAEDDEQCVNVYYGSIGFAGENICDKLDKIDPSPDSSPEEMPSNAVMIFPPKCDVEGAVRIDSISSSVNLNTAYPGKTLICLTSTGNAIKITNSNQTLVGIGITLYLENSGDIEISGGTVKLEAPGTDPDPDPAIPGVLIYVNPANPSVITINGNSESSYFGMIYAPNASVEVTGSGTIDDPTVYNTQIIASNVTVGGGAYIDITFDDMIPYIKPSSVDLNE